MSRSGGRSVPASAAARPSSFALASRVRVGCAHACKSATRRRGLTQGCGSVPGRTRAPQGRAPVPNAPCPKPEACPAARPHVGLGSAAPPAIEGGCVASVGRGGAMRGCSVWPTHGRSDGTMGTTGDRSARGSVLLVSFFRGINTDGEGKTPMRSPQRPPRMPSTPTAQHDDPIPPITVGARVLYRCRSMLAGYHPS